MPSQHMTRELMCIDHESDLWLIEKIEVQYTAKRLNVGLNVVGYNEDVACFTVSEVAWSMDRKYDRSDAASVSSGSP
jgi:hypothetical protein